MSQIKKPRSDVVRHRTALLDAASRVFAEHGVHVPLDLVSEAAGVGRATLYRHFPDRAALLLALVDRALAPLWTAGEGSPTGEVLITKVKELGRAASRATAFADAWREIARDQAEMQQRHDDITASFEQPLADAIASGAVRPDLTLDDLVKVMRMVVAANGQDQDVEGAERIIDLVLNGIGNHG